MRRDLIRDREPRDCPAAYIVAAADLSKRFITPVAALDHLALRVVGELRLELRLQTSICSTSSSALFR